MCDFSDDSNQDGTKNSSERVPMYPALHFDNVVIDYNQASNRGLRQRSIQVSFICSYASYNSVLISSNSRMLKWCAKE